MVITMDIIEESPLILVQDIIMDMDIIGEIVANGLAHIGIEDIGIQHDVFAIDNHIALN